MEWESKLQELAQLFKLQVAHAIYKKDSRTTGDAILNLFGCARSVEGQPMVVGQLIAISIQGMAVETVAERDRKQCARCRRFAAYSKPYRSPHTLANPLAGRCRR